MNLPDYWLSRPVVHTDASAALAFDSLWNGTLEAGSCPTVEYTLPWPKWQFLCHLGDRHEVAFHGSGESNITEFEPRQSDDLSEFGNQKAVYAASDALWAMFFAVVDRDRVQSVTNACVRLEDETGNVHGPYYVFSVSQAASAIEPWRVGTLYVLPREGFVRQSSIAFGPSTAHLDQLASLEPVRPLARLPIAPDDFPFLGDIRRHDHERLDQYATALATGAPWP